MARARETTPRPKKATDGKKAATPRRRASPRNRKPPPDAEPKKKEKHRQKEEKDKNKEEDNEQIAPPPPPSSSLATVNEEEEGEGEDMKQETKAEKAEAETQEAAAAAAGEELPPAQDTQLRRTYLQRMYRQLQSTHPNQDDAMIRQIATNVEMEACQKAATRHQYVSAMDHEIHKLMQFELEQANAPVYTNDPAQSYQSEQGQQPAVSSGMDSGYSQNQISQSHSYEYAQALAKAQEQEQVNCSGRSSSFSTPRQSMSGDVSFQSLMENQNQGYGRDGMQSHQQQNT
ncbi:uncharacterized protein IUM83_11980 [Phytophthora cinnamomi]|uniref:uncharacterized protein n=1 Tax=Phytophthora cinnamomi TaxID=4785 RepID=UPI003559C500|nr:hypothetical protein IUM83_11980 [Phytophthora cinnamomi]